MNYTILGLMSGTSLDGLDMALCRYRLVQGKWSFHTIRCKTVPYSSDLQKRLKVAVELDGEALTELDLDWGHWVGNKIMEFFKEHLNGIDAIACHGHTVFHQPNKGLTLQIGNAVVLHQITGVPIVNDFRTLDVLKGGQGAPLVPVGDQQLFSSYAGCLNLGGIANVTVQNNNQFFAYDICPANMLLNYACSLYGMEYDAGGAKAKEGSLSATLLQELEGFSYYNNPLPKSLGLEEVSKFFFSKINKQIGLSEQLHTLVAHIATQIVQALNGHINNGVVLVTGGGSHNHFLISEIQKQLKEGLSLLVPDQEIIDFKEAIIFGFLGLLKIRNEINVDRRITGAESDSIAGTIIGR